MLKIIQDKIYGTLGQGPATKFKDEGIPVPNTKLSKIASSIGDILHAFRLARKLTIKDAIDIDGIQDEYTFTTKDFGLVAAIEIQGVYSLMSEEDFDRACDRIQTEWTGMLGSAGVQLDWAFMGGDKEMVRKQAYDMLTPSINTLKRLDMDLSHVLYEKIAVLEKHCRYEKCYLCVWVDPRIATTAAESRKISQSQETIHKEMRLRGTESLEVLPVTEMIDDRLNAYVDSIVTTLKSLNIKARRETAKKMLKEIRLMSERQTDYNWVPRMPGESPIRRKTKNNPHDHSHILPPAIATQIFPNAVGDLVDTSKMINYGGRLFGGVVVELACVEVMPFAVLFRAMRSVDIPYRVRITVAGDGLSGTGLQVKMALANLLSWTDFGGTSNKPLIKAVNQIRDLVADGSLQDVALRISAETWVDCNVDDAEYISTQKKELASNVEKLARAMQTWGSMETNQQVGDALDRSTSTYPGLKRLIPSDDAIVNFNKVVPLFPFTRMATVWDEGAMLLRTEDGKLIPFQPASSKQKEWAELWIGRQRFGKSLAMAARTLAVISAPGNNQIPFCFTTDIGYSSSGLINLIEHSLPKDKRYLVKHIKLSMRPEHSINPMDTQLCARYPTASHSEFLSNLIQVLLADASGEVDKYIRNMIPEVIKQAYIRSSDTDGRPKAYIKGQDVLIDRAIEKLGIITDGKKKLTWWGLVDQLFKRKQYHMASLAQRYAVPTIKELSQVAMEGGTLSEIYHRKQGSSGMSYVEDFSASINAAVDQFPILKQHTMFDIGQARIVALDIQALCGVPSQTEGMRKTAVAYMLARHVFMSRIAFDREDLNSKIGSTETPLIPQFAYEYHMDRVRDLEKTVKTMNYDEVHRATGQKSIVAQWSQDVREGPKFKIITSFATQGVHDIPDDIFNFTSTKVLMGLGDSDADDIADRMGLNNTIRTFLKRAKRPNKDGSSAVYIMDTDEGTTDYTGIFMLTLGASEIWAYSTTRDDDVLRKALYERVGVNKGLELLVKHFPETTCSTYFEELRAANKTESKIEFDREVVDLMVAGSFDRDKYQNQVQRMR